MYTPLTSGLALRKLSDVWNVYHVFFLATVCLCGLTRLISSLTAAPCLSK